ncbi:MAG: type I-U CRISPR-associated protein Csx17 [Desulfobacterales bacterium]|nr:type I-U CRISPR-associated protein Csx17 [Desulfobacterales bacterium]
MHGHTLAGCKTRPFSDYLKAVGVLRLVSEQIDPAAKGRWEGDCFTIDSGLSETDLARFFCDEYKPTPIVSPWNGGSGFYLGDNTRGVDAITASDHPRFKEYGDIITRVRSWPEIPHFLTVSDLLGALDKTVKKMRPGRPRREIEGLIKEVGENAPPGAGPGDRLDEIEARAKRGRDPDPAAWKGWWSAVRKARSKCNTIMRGNNKRDLMAFCRSRLPDSSLKWLDAVYVVRTDGEASYSPILGTGGNEGRLDLSNSFMRRVAELFIQGDPGATMGLFRSAVLGETTPGLVRAKMGQYDPGRAGGYNQGMEIETKEFKINPWNFVLAMEGALALAGAAARRNATKERSRLTTPFTVSFSSPGFTSGSRGEAGKSETWAPIWRNPASFKELVHLFGEGRAALGGRMAGDGVEFARAVGTLGVDRGIVAFERYGFLKRRGDSYTAVPAGRIPVLHRPELNLLGELDPISRAVRGFLSRFKNSPAGFTSAKANIDRAVFACSLKPDPDGFSGVVRALGGLERIIAARDRSKKPALERPLFGLSPRWISRCDDGSVEVRLAAALASIGSSGGVGPLRRQLAGVSRSFPGRWSKSKGARHWFGASFVERIARVLLRRMMEAEKLSLPRLPMEAGLPLPSRDVGSFVRGECDDAKIEELLWGFTLVNWKKYGIIKVRAEWSRALDDFPPPGGWALLKLLHGPSKIRRAEIKKEPRIAHLLMAGRVTEAYELAARRLRVSGLAPYDVVYEEAFEPFRLLASLMIPVRDWRRLESLVLKNTPDNS